ncbi:hypothetical protein [Paenibacillus senegalensis]|uniref:hypothetical protein n=1 Tax=Paenibacillus senegalensis TaxID=1465766 RepID=UPI000287CDD5|nr:hypothetical protein [Paenibacillus senegalensis]
MEPNAGLQSRKSRLYGVLGGAVIFTIIAASWVGNLLYYQAHLLDEPVFLEHYYEASFHPEETLELYYITHKSDDRRLISIQPILIREEEGRASSLDGEITSWRVVHSAPYGSYGPYQVHKVSVQKPYDWTQEDDADGETGTVRGEVEESDTGEVGKTEAAETAEAKTNENEGDGAAYHFREMKAWFQDGTSYLVSVGDIQLLPWNLKNSIELPWSGISSMGSSTGEFSSTVRVNSDLEMTEIELALADRIGDAVDYQLNSRDFRFSLEHGIEYEDSQEESWMPPHVLKEGDHFTVEYTFRFPDGDVRQSHVYYSELRMKLEGLNEDGAAYSWFERMHHSPWLNKANVRQVVKNQREEE